MAGTKKNQRLFIRVTDEFKQEFVEMAKELGITQSELVRQAILLYMSMIGGEAGKLMKNKKEEIMQKHRKEGS